MGMPQGSRQILLGVVIMSIYFGLNCDTAVSFEAPLTPPVLILPTRDISTRRNAPVQFLWRSVDWAKSYTLLLVRISKPEERFVYRGITWPRKTIRNLDPGLYTWKVVAYGKNESIYRKSKSSEFVYQWKGAETEEFLADPLEDTKKEEPKKKNQEEENDGSRFHVQWLNMESSTGLFVRSFNSFAIGGGFAYTPHLMSLNSPVNIAPHVKADLLFDRKPDTLYLLRVGAELQIRVYPKYYVGLEFGEGLPFQDEVNRRHHYFGFTGIHRVNPKDYDVPLDRFFVRFEMISTQPRFRYITFGAGINL